MNIIEELFHGNVSGCNRKMPLEYKECCHKELELYNKLIDTLHTEYHELLEKFIKAKEDTLCFTEQDFYILGFKTGLLLGVESSKIDLWKRPTIEVGL